jgi:uncharacterized integral membrane protein
MTEKPEPIRDTSERDDSLRMRSVLYLVALLIYLGATLCLGYILWNVVIIWITSPNSNEQILMGLTAITMIIIEASLGLYMFNLIRWAFTGTTFFNLQDLSTLFLPFIKNKPMPLKKRMITGIIASPMLIVLDLTLLIVVFVILNVDDLSRLHYFDWMNTLFAVFGLITTIIGSILLVLLHINYLHWVITGTPIKSIFDLWDWSIKSK